MATFRVLSWNTWGIKSYGFFLDFRKATRLLNIYNADIQCLQEMNFAKEKLLQLKNHEVYNKQIGNGNRKKRGIFNHNVILSKFNHTQNGEISFNKSRTAGALEKALWSDFLVEKKLVRIYNCHLEITRVTVEERINQIKKVLEHSKDTTSPVIICGDMNTTVPNAGMKRKLASWFHAIPRDETYTDERDERYGFEEIAKKYGFQEVFDIKKSTWAPFGTGWELLTLKLDWFLVRNVRIINSHLGKYLSDHRPLLVTCEI